MTKKILLISGIELSRTEHIPHSLNAMSPRGYFPLLVVSVVVLFAANEAAAAAATSPRPFPASGAMPWMCLERCGFNSSDISAQLAQLKSQSPSIVTAVSYEWGDLGSNGTFIFNGFTSVSKRVAEFAVSIPMLTTVRLSYIRQLFETSVAEKFALQVVEAAKREGNIDGFNFDFEPTDDSPSQDDAIGYANFLRTARKVFWAEGKMFLTVDVAEWSSIWNWTLINAALTEPFLEPSLDTPVGYLVTMSTYANGAATFVERLQVALATISPRALVIGLDVWHSDPAQMNATSVAFRIGALAAAGVCRVGVWQVPIPTFWAEQLALLFRICA